VLNSAFLEGSNHRQYLLKTISPSHPNCPRKVIPTSEPFELLHPVIYYLCTDQVCFSISLYPHRSQGVPICHDAEKLFAIADRLGLEKLAEKALIFLRDACDTTNIISRVFSEFALLHEEVGGIYEGYVREHWIEIGTQFETDFWNYLHNEAEIRREKVERRFKQLMTKVPQIIILNPGDTWIGRVLLWMD
jgi:hypothetical protein